MTRIARKVYHADKLLTFLLQSWGLHIDDALDFCGLRFNSILTNNKA